MAQEKKTIRFKIPRISYNAPVVLTFAIIAVIALILNQMTGGRTNQLYFSVYRSDITPLFFVRLIGHVFGHANWAHLSGNMMLFLLLGPILEEKYGSSDLLIMILVTAAISGLLNIVLFPEIALCGASGIVFMFIILSSASCMHDGRIPLTMILILVIYLGGEIMDGLFQKDNISQFTHIIGGLIGAFFGYMAGRNKNA